MSEISKASDLLNKIEEVAVSGATVVENNTVESIPQETIKVEEVTITDNSGDSNLGTATVITDTVEDGKPLSEYAYDQAAEELKKKAEEDMLNSIKEEDMPQVNLDTLTKEEAIEQLTNDITETIEENSNKSPDEVFEAIATDLYSKIEKKESENKILQSKCNDLEDMVKSLNSEIIKLKHGSDKIDIIDDRFGQFAVIYSDRKSANNDADKIKLSTKLASNLLGMTKMVYPEIEVKEVLDMVSAKRNKGIDAIQNLTQSGQRDITIQDKATEVKSRPSPYVFSSK